MLFRATPPIAREASEASFFCDTPLVRSVFGRRWAIFTERSGGVAAIVCDTTGNAVRQGYYYTCLAVGGGHFGRVTKKIPRNIPGKF